MKTYIKPTTVTITLQACLPIAVSGVEGTANMNETFGGSTDSYLSRQRGGSWEYDE